MGAIKIVHWLFGTLLFKTKDTHVMSPHPKQGKSIIAALQVWKNEDGFYTVSAESNYRNTLEASAFTDLDPEVIDDFCKKWQTYRNPKEV